MYLGDDLLAEAATDPFKQVAKRFQHVKCGFGCDDPIILDTKTFQHDVNRATRIQDYRQLIDAGVLEKPAFEWLANILNDNRDWNMFTLNDALPGVVIVRDLFRKEYLSSLYQHLLFELPRQHVDLLKSNEKLCNIKHLTDNQLIRSNLRWVTFGYHYDWTEKIYRTADMNTIPDKLNRLLDGLVALFRFPGRLEAGIVNYYTCKSRLSPHSDNREPNTSAALFSLSLGQPALFLLGMRQRYERPVLPVLLRDGDLMIMSDESRIAFHSMNRLICDQCDCDRKTIKRININARQVF